MSCIFQHHNEEAFKVWLTKMKKKGVGNPPPIHSYCVINTCWVIGCLLLGINLSTSEHVKINFQCSQLITRCCLCFTFHLVIPQGLGTSSNSMLYVFFGWLLVSVSEDSNLKALKWSHGHFSFRFYFFELAWVWLLLLKPVNRSSFWEDV